METAVDLLDLYVAVWRPIMRAGEGCPFLFPGDGPDRPKWKKTLSSTDQGASLRLQPSLHAGASLPPRVGEDLSRPEPRAIRGRAPASGTQGHQDNHRLLLPAPKPPVLRASMPETILGIRDGEDRLESH